MKGLFALVYAIQARNGNSFPDVVSAVNVLDTSKLVIGQDWVVKNHLLRMLWRGIQQVPNRTNAGGH